MKQNSNILDKAPNPPHRPPREELTPQQERYVVLKCTTNLNNKQIADQLDVHRNTINNWNKNPLIIQAINDEIEQFKKGNQLGMQKLMKSLIKNSTEILDRNDIGMTYKIQIIGQLFSTAGKLSGLEPAKQVKKNVKVEKTIESLIDAEYTDVE